MPKSTDIIDAIKTSLRTGSMAGRITPAIFNVCESQTVASARYPNALVRLVSESFKDGKETESAQLTIRLQVDGGRPDDPDETVADSMWRDLRSLVRCVVQELNRNEGPRGCASFVVLQSVSYADAVTPANLPVAQATMNYRCVYKERFV